MFLWVAGEARRSTGRIIAVFVAPPARSRGCPGPTGAARTAYLSAGVATPQPGATASAQARSNTSAMASAGSGASAMA